MLRNKEIQNADIISYDSVDIYEIVVLSQL